MRDINLKLIIVGSCVGYDQHDVVKDRGYRGATVDSPPDPRNAESLVYVYTILYDRLARFYSRDITNTSPPWPITYNLYLSTDGATVENGPAHAPYPPCHGKEAKPRSVTMDLLTTDPVRPSAHTCTLLTCLLRRRPRTVGDKHKAYTLPTPSRGLL